MGFVWWVCGFLTAVFAIANGNMGITTPDSCGKMQEMCGGDIVESKE